MIYDMEIALSHTQSHPQMRHTILSFFSEKFIIVLANVIQDSDIKIMIIAKGNYLFYTKYNSLK